MSLKTEAETDLLDKLKTLKVESTDDFVQFMREQEQSQAAAYRRESHDSTKFPKISLFYGISEKGEVNYETWRFEIDALVKDRRYSSEQLMLGVRRSVKGEAANILRRLGTTTNIDEVLDKFKSIYGNIDTSEIILRKLYACEQKHDTVIGYAAKLEEIFAQACDAGAVDRRQNTLLKSVFYQGLSQPLKQSALFKFETVKDYDEFKIEVRKLEQETSRTQCNVNQEKKTELGEVKTLLEKMNRRIETLEREKETPRQYRGNYETPRHDRGNYETPRQYRGNYETPRHYRGNYRTTRETSRGRGFETLRRPIASETFKPRGMGGNCYKCGLSGHFAHNCTRPLND